MKKSKKLLILIMALAMTVCMAVGIFSANAAMLIMSSGSSTTKGQATAIDFAFDKNGITPKTVGSVGFVDFTANPPLGAYQSVSEFGVYSPYGADSTTPDDDCYVVQDDGSIFVLEGNKFTLLSPGYGSGEFDLSKVVNMNIQVDPQNAWAPNNGLGRLTISLYEDKEFLFSDKNNCWNFNGGSEAKLLINIWPTSGTAKDFCDNAAMKNKVTLETANGIIASSSDIAFDGNWVNISFFIGDDPAKSFFKVNGTNILNGTNGIDGLKASDFSESGSTTPSRTGYMGIHSFHKPTELKMQISQKNNAQVSFRANVSGFSAPSQTVYAGKTISLPTPSVISGYSFDNWYLDEGCTVKLNPADHIYGDANGEKVIYAKYLDNNKTDRTVTLKSATGGFADVTIKVDDGDSLNIGKVFDKIGQYTTWEYTNGTAYNGEAITANTTLNAVWHEEKVSMYKVDSGATSTIAVSNSPDANGWDKLYTDNAAYNSYVDATTGEMLMNRFYGGDRSQGSFETEEDYSIFVLKQAGSITNLMPLDVTKEIVIKFNPQNWDYNDINDNVASGLTMDSALTFQLFDSVKEALMSGHDSGFAQKGEKVAIRTSLLNRVDRYGRNNYGKFYDVINGVESTQNFKYVKNTEDAGAECFKYQWYTFKIGITADGNGNYLVIEHSRTDENGENEEIIRTEQIQGALAGLKQSDFVDGIAYVHIANIGSTTAISSRITQKFEITKKAATNGSFTVEYVDESNYERDASDTKTMFAKKTMQEGVATGIRFGAKIKITATPNEGFGVTKVMLGDKELLMPSEGGTIETVMSLWDDGDLSVEFGRNLTVKFETNGATRTLADKVVRYGEKLSKPSKIFKTGATFVCWCSNPELTEEYDFNSIVTEDITIYARWSDSVIEGEDHVGGGSTGGDNTGDSGNTGTTPDDGGSTGGDNTGDSGNTGTTPDDGGSTGGDNTGDSGNTGTTPDDGGSTGGDNTGDSGNTGTTPDDGGSTGGDNTDDGGNIWDDFDDSNVGSDEPEYKTCGGSLGVTAIFPALIAMAFVGIIVKFKKRKN